MSIIADVVRPFWVPGLNDISGSVTKGLGDWFTNQEFQAYDPLRPKLFILTITIEKPLLSALAFDCNRMAIASFETVSGVIKNGIFPKSTAWLVIQSYYAAFFAAHSILRMLGISCSHINVEHANSIQRIVNIFGQAQGLSVSQGFYKCVYDSSFKKLICTRLNSSGGVHEIFWSVFYQKIRDLSNEILLKGKSPRSDQLVATQLLDLCTCLSFANCGNGSWLSFVRNEVNYRHQFSSWYPYKDYKSYYDRLHDSIKCWKLDPIKVNLKYQNGKDLQHFMNTCIFIIGCCRVLARDMSKRCSQGKSFHLNGSIAFVNLLDQRLTKASKGT